MSGPMQWSPGLGFVPANGTLPPQATAPDLAEFQARPAVVPVQMEPLAPTSKPASKSKPRPAAPKNVLALAKARLREVKKELRNKAALEKERDELERLIAAAERPRVDKRILREVKSNAG